MALKYNTNLGANQPNIVSLKGAFKVNTEYTKRYRQRNSVVNLASTENGINKTPLAMKRLSQINTTNQIGMTISPEQDPFGFTKHTKS